MPIKITNIKYRIRKGPNNQVGIGSVYLELGQDESGRPLGLVINSAVLTWDGIKFGLNCPVSKISQSFVPNEKGELVSKLTTYEHWHPLTEGMTDLIVSALSQKHLALLDQDLAQSSDTPEMSQSHVNEVETQYPLLQESRGFGLKTSLAG